MGGDHEISRRSVARDGDVPNHRHAEERFDIRVMGNRLKGVPKKYQKIDFPVGNLGPDLLIAAQRPALQFVNLNAQFLFQYCSGRTGGIDLVMGQKNPGKIGLFNQVVFLIVMGDKGDLLVQFHFHLFINHNAPSRFLVL